MLCECLSCSSGGLTLAVIMNVEGNLKTRESATPISGSDQISNLQDQEGIQADSDTLTSNLLRNLKQKEIFEQRD